MHREEKQRSIRQAIPLSTDKKTDRSGMRGRTHGII
jgi:hypothetical protein